MAVHNSLWPNFLQAPRKHWSKFPYIGHPERTLLAGMLDALDDSTGHIVEALYSAGMLKNTIIAFSSDNGASVAGNLPNFGSNWPLRGNKDTLWEGSVRVPGFIWSPLLGNFNKRVSDQLMHISDWLPTLYEAAGGSLKAIPQIDGVSLWQSLLTNKASPRKEFLLNIKENFNSWSYRFRDYKIIFGKGNVAEGDWYPTLGKTRPESPNTSPIEISSRVYKTLRKFYKSKTFLRNHWREEAVLGCRKSSQQHVFCFPAEKPCLFNIKEDPCEIVNIADEERSILNFLLLRISRYNRTVVPSESKPVDPAAYPEYHGGVWTFWKDE